MHVARMTGRLVAAFCVLALLGADASAAETTVTPIQIETWIKQLGNEDFQKREEARAALLKAGLPAMDALKKAKESGDNEVRNAAALLVEQLQWQAIPAKLDYLKLFPAETIFALKIRDLDGFMKGSQGTSMLKMLEGPELKPMTDLLTARAKEELGPALAIFQKWLGHFSGQMAGGAWAITPMDPTGMRMALVAELKADSVEQVFKEFLAETRLMHGAVPTPLNGLMILKGPNEMGAIALVGHHVVLGPNVESIRIVAENMLETPPNALTTKPSYAQAMAAVGGEPEMTFLMDIQQYLNFVGTMIPGPEGKKMADMMRKLGYDSMESVLMTTRIVGDQFEDRFTLVLNNKPSRLVDLMNQVYSADSNVKKAFEPVPANAVVAASGYLDAAPMYRFILDWVKEMAQVAENVKPEEMEKNIAGFEQMTGVELQDLFGTMKGDVSFWVELAPALAPPHVGCCVQCPDAAKAQELTGYVGKFLDIAGQMAPPANNDPDGMQPVPEPGKEGEPKPAGQDQGQPVKPPAVTFQKADFKGHTIYTESPESPLVAAKGRAVLPYRLTWATHGSRVLFTSSVVQMEKRLAALDAGTPGLDPFKLLPPGNTDTAAIKSMMVVDIKRAMDFGAKFGLPILASVAGQDKELQTEIARLGELAAEKSIFEQVKPLVAVGMAPKGLIQTGIMWTPAPYIPTVFLGIGGAATFTTRQARAMGPGAIQPPAPPPDVKF